MTTVWPWGDQIQHSHSTQSACDLHTVLMKGVASETSTGQSYLTGYESEATLSTELHAITALESCMQPN